MKRLTGLLLLILTLLLAACSDATAGPASTGDPPAQGQTPFQAATGTFQEFALPQKGNSLMYPALDGQGRIWFAVMGHNYLGSFDPRGAKFWQGTPPGGKSGVMGIVAAPDNTIWFAEQFANYIGHFSPQTGTYRTYPLPIVTMPDPSNPGQNLRLPSAPNELVLDQHGTLWFTELNANALGSLNTATGTIRQYPLCEQQKGKAVNSYGIASDPHGLIWFTEASSSRLGRLDPASGQVSYFTPPGVASPLMEVAADALGRIWATTFTTGQLIEFEPVNSHFTIYTAPGSNSSGTGGLYGLLVAGDGNVWVAITARNSLACFKVREQRFLTYAIPTPNSLPVGLVEDKQHTIWFTESGSDKIGSLQP